MESVSGKNLTDLLRPQSENADLKIRSREFSLLFSPGGALLLFPLEAEEFQSKGAGTRGKYHRFLCSVLRHFGRHSGFFFPEFNL